MIYDYNYFLRRYKQIEEDFLEITDFIELKTNCNAPCYEVGSSKLMDFCLKVGTEIETLFKVILRDEKFDAIRKKGDERSIDKYRPIIEQKYHLSNYELFTNSIKKKIKPFKDFDNKNPEWFKIYSRSKHDKLDLVDKWNLRHSLFALGCLLILVINHPDLKLKEFRKHQVSQRVFDLLDSEPRFGFVTTEVKF